MKWFMSREKEQNWRIDHAQAKLKIIEQSFKDALNFLKKKYKNPVFYKYKMPWYLIMGPQDAGKTSLLAKSGLDFTSTDKQPLPFNVINSTLYCDWWFSSNAVVLDISGELFIQQSPEHNPNPVWYGLLKLLKRYRRRQSIDGIIVAIDLPNSYVQDRAHQQLQYDSICHHIQTLASHIKELPVYLVFTKCDLIAGFRDFFTHMSLEEQEQICGISLTKAIDPQSLPQLLSEHYDNFLKRLQEQLVWRLHHERSMEKRARIYDFPLQLESQKRFILNLAVQLNSSKTRVQGIYFTSSLHDGKTVDYLMQPLSHVLNIPQYDILSAPQYKSFFIRNMFNRILTVPVDKKPALQSSFAKYRKFNLSISAFALIFCLFCWQSYTNNMNTVDAVKTSIVHNIHNDNATSAYSFLPILNTLQAALDIANQHYDGMILRLGFHQAHELKTHLNNTYDETIHTKLLPQLQQILETQIQEANINNPELLYNVLKSYLILGNKTDYNKSFVQNWFKNYWQKTLPDDAKTQMQLQMHLKTLLDNDQIKFNLNQQIIKTAQAQLNTVELPKLLFLFFRDQYPSMTLKLNTVEVNIAALYVPANFNDIYFKAIPSFCHQNTNKTWLLGKDHPSRKDLSETEINQLITEMRKLYINHYMNAWQEQLSTLKVNFHNLKEAKAALDAFSGPQSAFIQILNSWKISLQPILTITEFKLAASDQMQMLNQLTTYANNPITQKAIRDMAADISRIASAANTNREAWVMAKNRMESGGTNDAIDNLITLAQHAPAPFDSWLNNIANGCWRMILQSTETYLNQVWATEVLPQYNNYIKFRYPIFRDSNNEMTLNEFTQFFGPHGTMDNFFNRYLQAFVDTSQLYWVWKPVDRQKVNIPQPTLEMFIRAALIRKMYFPNNSAQPHTEFTLIPDMLSTTAQDFVLNLEGQQISYTESTRKVANLKWPGPKPNSATAEFVGSKTPVLATSGPWALFRLFDNGNLIASQNSKFYKIAFDIQGNSANYELIADNVINPFIPGILNNFRCPDKL